MKSALHWLWWDVLSWNSPYPGMSGALMGLILAYSYIFILYIISGG